MRNSKNGNQRWEPDGFQIDHEVMAVSATKLRPMSIR